MAELIQEDTFSLTIKKIPEEATFTFQEVTIGETMDFADDIKKYKGADAIRYMIQFYETIMVEEKSSIPGGITLEKYFRKMFPTELTQFSDKYQGLFTDQEKK